MTSDQADTHRPRLRVSAYQMTRERFNDESVWPDWVKGSVVSFVDWTDARLRVGETVLDWDDWLVLHGHEVAVWHPEDFERQFEPIPCEA